MSKCEIVATAAFVVHAVVAVAAVASSHYPAPSQTAVGCTCFGTLPRWGSYCNASFLGYPTTENVRM